MLIRLSEPPVLYGYYERRLPRRCSLSYDIELCTRRNVAQTTQEVPTGESLRL